jgi:hypothetical protein
MSVAPHHVWKVRLPAGSLLEAYRRPGDFLDCYAAPSAAPVRQVAEEIVRFPGWARALIALRNTVTTPLGLSADGPPAADKLGVFPVEAETGEEIVAGFDDRHLDFRVSVIARHGRVSLATWVWPHNIGGRLYLAAILPCHIAIARDAVARVSRMSGP